MSSLEFMDPCQISEGMGHSYMNWRWRHFSIWNTSRRIGERGEGLLMKFLNNRTKDDGCMCKKNKTRKRQRIFEDEDFWPSPSKQASVR